MEIASRVIVAAEGLEVPDVMSKAGIRYIVGRSRKLLNSPKALSDAEFLEMVAPRAIAVHTEAANEQHYELPTRFYAQILGPHKKYSCCRFESGINTLEEAEVRALAQTSENADLQDGQSILELGCGWGSMTLWMAEHFPNSKITAVSNSSFQRDYIANEAAQRGFKNVTVLVCDMNTFETDDRYDRIISVEMFEHMSNWRKLLTKARRWIHNDGRLFIHVFTHRKSSYLFDENDKSDWIAQHFFTGGIMPSHTLMRQFADLFEVEQDWRWSGKHYEKTAKHWLVNFDSNSEKIQAILQDVYGDDARVWQRRWRLFFLSTMGLFGHANGDEWGVSHYRLAPSQVA